MAVTNKHYVCKEGTMLRKWVHWWRNLGPYECGPDGETAALIILGPILLISVIVWGVIVLVS
jgi:hypothetical protein